MHSEPAPPDAWTEWGGEGRRLVFGHANGFPPAAYRVLLEKLASRFSVASYAARPLWPGSDPSSVVSWQDLAGDLKLELDRREVTGAVGLGHSMGGVLHLLTASTNCSSYSALVLVDPVVFTGSFALFWGALKIFGLGPRLPLIRGARRRRETFYDLDEVRRSYAGKPVFASWNPQVFEDYVTAGFRETGSGQVTLRYPRSWEAKLFEATPSNVWAELRKIRVPMLVVRGSDSDTFLASAADRMRRELPAATVIDFPGCSHFVPMERPGEIAEAIFEWACEIGV